jgi:hypothetical protein
VPADLDAVVAERWPEDEQLELKQELPAKPDQRDRWTKSKEIVDRAKIAILSEVVAFANSYGGDLILGISESSGNPKRADASTPVSHCADLAERLAMCARDSIEPQIPRLELQSIPINDSGEGYVVIRVPKSRLAPHRLKNDKECYRRRGGNSEPMTMREIQDLTFAVARGVDAVGKRLDVQRAEFRDWVRVGAQTGYRLLSVRATGTPASSDLFVDRVHDVLEILPPRESFRVKLEDGEDAHTFTSPLSASQRWRPVLRGTQAREGFPTGQRRSHIQLDCDGTVSYWWGVSRTVDLNDPRQGYKLYAGWLFAVVLNALKAADRFRAHTAAHAVEYVFEIEIVPDIELPVIAPSHWEPREAAGTLPASPPLVLPRYTVGDIADRGAVLNLMWRDFWNAVGVETKPDEFKLV